jgi:hypothetical protein
MRRQGAVGARRGKQPAVLAPGKVEHGAGMLTDRGADQLCISWMSPRARTASHSIRAASSSQSPESTERATHAQGFVHKVPPCRITLRGRKSRPGYPENHKTLGEHLRRARLDRGLPQRQVAEALQDRTSCAAFLSIEELSGRKTAAVAVYAASPTRPADRAFPHAATGGGGAPSRPASWVRWPGASRASGG